MQLQEFFFIDEGGFNLARTRGGRKCHWAQSHYKGSWPKLVCWPPRRYCTISRAIPPTVLILSEPHTRVTLAWKVSWPNYGKAMWRNLFRCDLGMIRRSRCFIPPCLARKDVVCDVNDASWPDTLHGNMQQKSGHLKLCAIRCLILIMQLYAEYAVLVAVLHFDGCMRYFAV